MHKKDTFTELEEKNQWVTFPLGKNGCHHDVKKAKTKLLIAFTNIQKVAQVTIKVDCNSYK